MSIDAETLRRIEVATKRNTIALSSQELTVASSQLAALESENLELQRESGRPLETVQQLEVPTTKFDKITSLSPIERELRAFTNIVDTSASERHWHSCFSHDVDFTLILHDLCMNGDGPTCVGYTPPPAITQRGFASFLEMFILASLKAPSLNILELTIENGYNMDDVWILASLILHSGCSLQTVHISLRTTHAHTTLRNSNTADRMFHALVPVVRLNFSGAVLDRESLLLVSAEEYLPNATELEVEVEAMEDVRTLVEAVGTRATHMGGLYLSTFQELNVMVHEKEVDMQLVEEYQRQTAAHTVHLTIIRPRE
ncbi:hypothetical protein DXG01_003535 [Tephrocybe rancida]|nr:hypothetical protein DXG01_003535 [Tephrocybe rancida]